MIHERLVSICALLKRQPVLFAVAAGILAATAGASGFQGWTTDVVDDTVNAGVVTDFAFAPDGSPAVAYTETARTDSLFFAKGVGAASPTIAERQVVDRGRSISYMAMGYNPTSAQASIAYTAGDLRFASQSATGWIIESLARTGNPGDIAYDSSGFPGIVFTSPNGKTSDIKVALRSNAGWTIEVVSLKAGVDAFNTAIAFDHTDVPVVAFCKNHTLFLARRAVGGWTVTAIDSIVSASGFQFGFQPDLAFDTAGNATIAYMSEDKSTSPVARELYYAVWNGSSLQRVAVDTVATRGASLAFDRGEPAIAYVAAGGLQLRLVRRLGLNWTIESVATLTTGSVGLPALAFSPLTFEPAIGWNKGGINDVVLSRGVPQ